MLIRSRLLQSWPQRLRAIASVAAAGTQPSIPAIPETVQAYGDAWQDDYHWIKSNPQAIQKILRQEADHFRHVATGNISSIAAVSSQLRAEIQSLLPHQTASVGEVFEHGWEYISEQSKEHPMPIYSRRRRRNHRTHREDFEKEILLDINELDHLYGVEGISIGQIKLSKCGNLVACTFAENGVDDLYSVLVRDVKSNTICEQTALKGVVSIEWDGNNETLFATQPDELGRPAKVVCTQFSRENSINTKNKQQRNQQSSTVDLNQQLLQVVYEENDPRFFLELQRTKDWNYLMINSNSKTSSEVYILPTSTSTSAAGESGGGGCSSSTVSLTCVQPRMPGLEYFLEHLDGKLYIISNAGNENHNYDLYSVQVNLKEDGAMNKKFWKKLKPTSSNANGSNDVCIEDLDVNHNGIILYQRSSTTGNPEIEIIPINSLKDCGGDGDGSGGGSADGGGAVDTKQRGYKSTILHSYRPQLPEYAWSITPGANADFYSDTLRIMISSPVHPDTALDWDLKSTNHIERPVKQQKGWIQHDMDAESSVLNHNPDEYVLEKTWAPMLHTSPSTCPSMFSNPQQKVPMSLIYSKSRENNREAPCLPCLVVVYAAYGINLPTDFLLERLPLLKRGWTIALVHARGGGELGRQWHAAGRGPENKLNSALDIESAVEYLIQNGYTKAGSITLEATSAGAVAAGGVLNRRPELFGGVVLESPFVDVLSTMIDPELPLTVHEYEEFGDPSTKMWLQGLKNICPYSNIKISNKGDRVPSSSYPPVLITCSSTDARVPIWGPLKYAAKLRAAARGTKINKNVGGGDGGTGKSHRPGVDRGSVLVFADGHEGHLADDREKYDIKAVQYAFLLEAIKHQQRD